MAKMMSNGTQRIRQADGTYRKHVYAREHNNVQGEYNVHLYYVQNDGRLVGAGGIKTNVSISKPQGKIQYSK